MRVSPHLAAFAGLLLLGCGSDHLFERGEPLADAGSPDGGTGGPVSFRADVDPIFAASCTSCHGGGAGGLVLTGTPASDYPAAAALVNGGNPAASLIYAKPTGLVSHGGGTVLAVSSAQARTILAWCEQGAPNN